MKRSPMPKRARRIRRRRLVLKGSVSDKDLDAACRAVVFARDGYRCVMCGTDKNLQWSHVRNRSYKIIKWWPPNSKALCSGCHKFKWHADRPGFDKLAWFRSKFPGRLEQIDQFYLDNKGKKLDRWLTLLWLQQELKRLRAA